jgi:hypothetical protein
VGRNRSGAQSQCLKLAPERHGLDYQPRLKRWTGMERDENALAFDVPDDAPQTLLTVKPGSGIIALTIAANADLSAVQLRSQAAISTRSLLPSQPGRYSRNAALAPRAVAMPRRRKKTTALKTRRDLHRAQQLTDGVPSE